VIKTIWQRSMGPGGTLRRRATGGRANSKPRLGMQELLFLKALWRIRPDSTLDEYVHHFATLLGMRVGRTVVWRGLMLMRLTMKNKTRQNADKLKPLPLARYALFLLLQPHISWLDAVIIDETKMKPLDTQRRRARSEAGTLATEFGLSHSGRDEGIWWRCAMDCYGPMLPCIKPVSDNGTAADFETWFVNDLLPAVMAAHPAGAWLILDNAPTHRRPVLRAIIAHTNAVLGTNYVLLFLPPYSPELSPIELFFAYLKHTVRGLGGVRTEAELDPLVQAVCADTVARKQHVIAGIFRHCGYN